MNLADFREAIARHPDCGLRIELAGGGAIAPHFHVTEVGRVEKDFVDCGGVRRREVRCVLQTLVADDADHRLLSTKLARILALVDRLDLPPESPVEVEHQERTVSTDVIDAVEREGDLLVIRLKPKRTACLAEDACGIGPDHAAGLPQLTTLDNGCGGPGCC